MNRRHSLLMMGIVLLLGLLWLTRQAPVAPPPDRPQVLRFESHDLAWVEIVRDGQTLRLERDGDGWRVQGQDWTPSTTVMRRLVHQLHDLRARAVVQGADLAAFGLGPNAVIGHLGLVDGSVLSLAVGDVNATGVSVYMRRLPDGPVVIVPKAGADAIRQDWTVFRGDEPTQSRP